MSPSGKLPFLALPDGKLITAEGFEAFVQENAGSDAPKLELDQASEAVAFTALAESKIHAALVSVVSVMAVGGGGSSLEVK